LNTTLTVLVQPAHSDSIRISAKESHPARLWPKMLDSAAKLRKATVAPYCDASQPTGLPRRAVIC